METLADLLAIYEDNPSVTSAFHPQNQFRGFVILLLSGWIYFLTNSHVNVVSVISFQLLLKLSRQNDLCLNNLELHMLYNEGCSISIADALGPVLLTVL